MNVFPKGRRALIVGALIATGLASGQGLSSASAASVSWVQLPNSVTQTTDTIKQAHPASTPLAITVALQPNNAAQLNTLLTNLYNPASSQYHQWLAKGQFNNLFAPTAAQQGQVVSYLQGEGMSILSSSSPFLVRAYGTTAQVEAAFNTHLSDYAASNGKTYFANDAAVSIPSGLSAIVSGVIGLSNTALQHPQYEPASQEAQARGVPTPQYGDSPGGNGLSPSQIEGLYNAGGAYSTTQGQGKVLAVFELSGYTQSDIVTYEHKFFGPQENVPITNVNVDGGPVNAICPHGDVCFPGYSGDIEVNIDIELQIALAPKIQGILVYNAPNDQTGQTEIDEYNQIAQDDLADSISSSWGACERDATFSQALAESVAFKQMAAQGQSMFAASGDTGAYACLRGSGNTGLEVLDPSSQPWVTGVGGTSFEGFDPRSDATPSYPAGFETVWNDLNACGPSLTYCSEFGAGGGGNSRFWAQPAYQTGPGVISHYTQYAPFCTTAANGQACREVPDVSMNADPETGYAVYCTGSSHTDSTCAQVAGNPPGWSQWGGTSCSSPLWSAIAALSDSYNHDRAGNANHGLYSLFRSPGGYTQYFHDISGYHQTENYNGFFPTTPFYDEATGIGTPNITNIVEAGL